MPRAAPVTSMRRLAFGSLDSGTCLIERASTRAAIGMLMKKIHRQDAAAIR